MKMEKRKRTRSEWTMIWVEGTFGKQNVDFSDEDASQLPPSMNEEEQERSEPSRLFELQQQIEQDNYTIQLKSEEVRRLTIKNQDFEKEVTFFLHHSWKDFQIKG